MPLRIRYQYNSGATLGYSIERLEDGFYYDFFDGIFKINPTVLLASLPEDSGVFAGRYKVSLNPTPKSQFTNGDYVVSIHDTGAGNQVVGQMHASMYDGSDSTIFPNLSSSSIDPWSIALPGAYPAGTAGFLMGTNLDARVSSRSTYNGGPVAGVVAPVTVGSNNDKSGYSLSLFGLDAIQVENGVNVRQAFSPILAASAGVLIGAGTGTIVIKGGNVAVTRITATTDNAGNRSAVTLSLPA